MKKVLCLLVVLLLVGSFALSETLDLGSMSDDELLTLKSKVDGEMAVRLIDDQPISDGVYAVGISFDQGGYTFSSHATEKDGAYVWVYLGLFNNEKDVWDDDKAVTTFCLTEDGKTYHLDLKEGQFLHITVPGGSCTYRKD